MKKSANQASLISHAFSPLRWISLLVVLLIGFGAGLLVSFSNKGPHLAVASKSSCLRLGGFTYISPLLLCDTNAKADSANLTSLQTKIQTVISSAQAANDIDTASVYFRDLTSRDQTSINGREKYFPASLNKIPIMMGYFRGAQSDPALLTTQATVKGTSDSNTGLEIQPPESAQIGKSYTVNDLITYMIKDSDNNSYNTLEPALGLDRLKAIFEELQIQYPEDALSLSDFITPYQFSLFLRTLYNSTILNQDYSEQALNLMTQTTFKDGLVAGVPSGTAVAHKFGIATQKDSSSKLVERQLHDCGIIYSQKSPYILCVMTKGSASLERAEKTIQDISAATYAEVLNTYK